MTWLTKQEINFKSYSNRLNPPKKNKTKYLAVERVIIKTSPVPELNGLNAFYKYP